MPINPCPKDANNFPLVDRWKELYTKVETVAEAGTTISLPQDCKEVLIHFPGTTLVGHITGTVTDSAAVPLYSDGLYLTIPIAKSSGTLFTLTAPSGGGNISVGVIAGR